MNPAIANPAIANLARLSRLARLARAAVLDNPTHNRSPRTSRNSRGWPGLYLGYGTNGPVYGGAEHHALILGPPRSGKTTRLAIPNLARHPGPAVVTSTKADIITATIKTRANKGRCYIWDPNRQTPLPAGAEPLRWSPVVGCQQWDQAVATAHALAGAARPDRHNGETHWIERAQAVLAPLLHAAALNNTGLPAVTAWLHRRELLEPLTALQQAEATLAADVLQGVTKTDPRELSGILSTADSLLAAYNTNTALDTTRNPNLDPATFPTSTDTIYLCPTGTNHQLHAPLIIALLDQIRTHTYHHKPRPPLLWTLDELAHIAPLPDLTATIAEGGSQGLTILACLQDLSQARHRWHQQADGFLTLFTHKIILPGIADTTTLRQISDLAGDTDIPVPTTSRDNRLISPTTTSWRPDRRPRLPINTIANGQPHQALLITRTTPHRVHI